MDVSCALETLACHDGLRRCIAGGVGLDPDSDFGCVSSWFEEIGITISWIAWLHGSMGAFDSDGLAVMDMMVWRCIFLL